MIAAFLVAVLAIFALDFNRATDAFATSEQVMLVCFVAGAAAYLLLGRM
jgi:hypothetical protein